MCIRPFFNDNTYFFGGAPTCVRAVGSLGNSVIGLFTIYERRSRRLTELVRLAPFTHSRFMGYCTPSSGYVRRTHHALIQCRRSFNASGYAGGD